MWHFSRHWRIYRIYDGVYNNWQSILYVWCWPAYYSWQVGEPLICIAFLCNLYSETLYCKIMHLKHFWKGVPRRSSLEELRSLLQCWRLWDSDVFHWQSASTASYRSNRVLWRYAFPIYWRDGKILCVKQEGKRLGFWSARLLLFWSPVYIQKESAVEHSWLCT